MTHLLLGEVAVHAVRPGKEREQDGIHVAAVVAALDAAVHPQGPLPLPPQHLRDGAPRRRRRRIARLRGAARGAVPHPAKELVPAPDPSRDQPIGRGERV
eukprot:6685788-Pyramimonas_sp.AAC.3